MKDAYSFHTSVESLNETYQKMYRAYCRIFARCGLDYLPVEAESGPIGGDASHEFMIPAANGEDQVVYCKQSGYAANLERAETGRKTPKIETPANPQALTKVATPNVGSIEAVCKLLKCKPEQMIKTLIYLADDQPIAVLIRGDAEANENKIRRALGVAKLELADPGTIFKVTGAPVGFAGPVGIQCKVIADHDVPLIANAITGANEEAMHLTGVNVGRDWQLDTTYDLRNAQAGDPSPRGEGSLELVRGIEVGHVFKLGTKYSVALEALYDDEKEFRKPRIMGCYGIGVNRIIAGLAETKHDENGLIWPLSVAPYSVILCPLGVTEPETMKHAETIYNHLTAAGIDVLMDDRDQRPGFKFKDADLIGIPLRVVIGGKGLKEGIVEVKWRWESEPRKIPLNNAVPAILDMLKSRRAEEAAKASN
jgi:prolyl-tRNA synthetase